MIPITMGVKPEVIQDNPDHLDELFSHPDHPFPSEGSYGLTNSILNSAVQRIGLSGRIRMCDI